LRRWTNGDAVVPLPAFLAPAVLEIQASSDGMVYRAESGRGETSIAAWQPRIRVLSRSRFSQQ
jgi:hypothetical protein